MNKEPKPSLKERWKKKWEAFRYKIELSDLHGRTKGTELVINNYVKYRLFMFYALFIGGVLLLVNKQYLAALICFVGWHLHSFINQIWWKIEHLER